MRAFECQQADLWSVAVGDDQFVIARHWCQRLGSLHDVGFLDVQLGRFAALKQRITAERGDYLHGRSPIVAIMVSGGERAGDTAMLEKAKQPMEAGATRLIFGRNVWQREHDESLGFVTQLREILAKYQS
jgi:hypothetical protein